MITLIFLELITKPFLKDFSTVVHIEVKAHPVVKEMFNSNTLRYK